MPFEPGLALEALRRKDAIGSYVVDLFPIDPTIAGPGAVDKAVVRFLEAIAQIPGGIEVKPALPEDLRSRLMHPTLSLSIRLLKDSSRRSIILPRELRGDHHGQAEIAKAPPSSAPTDLDPKRNEDVLALLAEQMLVRTVQPPLIIDEGNSQPIPVGDPNPLPAPRDSGNPQSPT